MPRLGGIVEANEVKVFSDACPFLEAYMHDITGFEESDLANLRVPLRPSASRTSERIAQIQEATLPPAPPLATVATADTQNTERR